MPRIRNLGRLPQRRLRMPSAPDVFLTLLALTVFQNGAVYYAQSIFYALAFGVLLLVRSLRREQEPPPLDPTRLRVTALGLILFIALWTVLQTFHAPKLALSDPAWEIFTTRIEAEGGIGRIASLQSLWGLPRVALPFLVFATAIDVLRREHDVRNAWRFLVVLGSTFAGWGLLQTIVFPQWNFGEKFYYRESVTGFYVNRNAAAALLYTTISATFAELERALAIADIGRLRFAIVRGRRIGSTERGFLWVTGALVLQTIALAATNSRGGVLVGLAIIGLWIIRITRSLRARVDGCTRRRLDIALVAIGGGLLAALTLRVAYRFSIRGIDDDRWCVLPDMIRLLWDAWPMGVGLDRFVTAFMPYRNPTCGLSRTWDTAHNGLIQGTTTLGVAFFLVTLVVVWGALEIIWSAMRSSTPSRQRGYGTAVAMSGLIFHSFFDFPLEIPGNSSIMALMFAMTMVSTTRRNVDHLRQNRTPSVSSKSIEDSKD